MSALPARSIALTWKTCGPPASGPAIVCGDVHAANSAPSSEHSNWFTASPEISSNPSKVNVALVSVVSSSGPVRTSVSGGDMSTTVQFRVAGVGSTLPASSMAATSSGVRPGRQHLDLLEGLAVSEVDAVEDALEVELERDRLVVGAVELEDADVVRRRGAFGRAVDDDGVGRRRVGPEDDLPLVERGRQVQPAELVDGLHHELLLAGLERPDRVGRRARDEGQPVDGALGDRVRLVGPELERRHVARARRQALGVQRAGRAGDDRRLRASSPARRARSRRARSLRRGRRCGPGRRTGCWST